jgi:aspartyl-tRNA(Asn)/glutamyl-tRNA(Gln) amidotransferase subunit C
MAIDKATVLRIAQLARIEVGEDALAPMADELNNIFAWVEQLGEVNTDDVPPMTSVVAVDLPQRDDVVNDGAPRDALLANAPDTDDGFFVVPKVVE